MHRRRFLHAAGVAAAACAACGVAEAGEGHAPHWAYEGADGPGSWAKIAPAFEACGAGREQSPIALGGATHADLADLRLDWGASRVHMLNNGHTIQAALDPGSRLQLDGKSFELKQFHFHHPSEHVAEGRSYPMEVHFVHVAADGAAAVVGVFIEPGARNPTVGRLWEAMPAREGERATEARFEPASLLPSDRRYWRYAGSLTTPPCSEVVNWLVLARPIEVAQDQIDAFVALYPNNARPLQDRNRRFLLSSF